jgi:two-component system, LuxR family, sensor kinase FixL
MSREKLSGLPYMSCLTEESPEEHDMESNHHFNQPEVCQAIFDTAVDAIVIIDQLGTIQTFNPSSERMFGYQAQEVIGKNINVLMPNPYHREHDQYLRNYAETGVRKIIGIGREVTAVRKNGHVFPVDLAVSEVKVEATSFFVGFIRDLSELKSLQNMIVSQSERERAEIGQDLHDVLAQQLTGLSLLCKSLQRRVSTADPTVVKLAGDVVELSQRAMEEARRLSHGLYPTELEKRGFVAALSGLTDNTTRLWNVACRLDTDLESFALDKSKALNLYRIAQEAITNAIKHGNATVIDLCLRPTANALEVEIHDNGSGFSDKPKPGMGTSIMKYRANLIGASLEIISNPNEGVRVICRLPNE